MKASIGKPEKLPNFIKLENPYPGEPPYMRKRKKPAVLRFHKIKQSTSPEDHFFAEALLYTAFKSEEELETRVKEAEKDGFETLEREINAVKIQVMEHLESNQEARHMAEEASKNIAEMGDQLDPEGEQDNEDCLEEEIQLHPDYEHLAANDSLSSEKTMHEKK